MNSNVDRNIILNSVAPCAFCCFTCPAMKGGVVEETSAKLSHYLQGYYEFNKKNLPLKYRPYSKKVKMFTEHLEKMSNARCNGCRNGADKKCCIPNCSILQCTKTHNIDFCAECSEFPCKKAEGFLKDTTLEEWRSNNERIKKYGIEEYYKYAVSRSHYQVYFDELHK